MLTSKVLIAIAYKAPYENSMTDLLAKLRHLQYSTVILCADQESFDSLPLQFREKVISVGDKGIYDAWNTALEFAISKQYEFVGFFGKDDTIDAKLYSNFVECALQGCKGYTFMWTNGVVCRRSLILKSHKIIHPGSLYKVSEIKSKFDVNWSINSDFDFATSYFLQGNFQFYKYNNYASLGKDGVSNTRYKSVWDTYRIRRRYYLIGSIWMLAIDTLSYLKRKILA